MLRIGLTGGIGSGKSTAAKFFIMRGVPVIDTDEIARQLTEPGQTPFDEILRHFGPDILDKNRRINREILRERVFDNANERKHLETILHPAIRAAVNAKLTALNAPYCIVVVPLLIETDFADLVERILVIDCNEALQIQRTQLRNGLSEAEIRKIMAVQANRAQRLQKAHDIIENNTDRKQLETEVERMHQWYLSLATTSQRN